MKRFRFTLEPVLHLRRLQLEQEQAAIETLHAKRRAIESETAALESETGEARSVVAGSASVEARDLYALAIYLPQAGRYREDLRRRLADCRARIEVQQERFALAGRRVKLLEHLEEARRGDWRKAFEREMELSAQELYLARWKR